MSSDDTIALDDRKGCSAFVHEGQQLPEHDVANGPGGKPDEPHHVVRERPVHERVANLWRDDRS